MQTAFEQVTGISHPVAEHTTEYFDMIGKEPDPDNPVELEHGHYAGPRSQKHLNELELFREFKGKPLWDSWVPDWTAVYWDYDFTLSLSVFGSDIAVAW